MRASTSDALLPTARSRARTSRRNALQRERTFAHRAALKALLRSAIRYSVGAADGAVTQVSGGPWQKSVDTRQAQSGVLFSPAQIERLEQMCRIRVAEPNAHSVRLGPPVGL
ncbi:hypothetical protein GS928_25440 [Rhodococcus hoagii]|nr:hypothetical protein [Prescottella equi]